MAYIGKLNSHYRTRPVVKYCIFAGHHDTRHFSLFCSPLKEYHTIRTVGALIELFFKRYHREKWSILCNKDVCVAHFGRKTRSLKKARLSKLAGFTIKFLTSKSVFWIAFVPNSSSARSWQFRTLAKCFVQYHLVSHLGL